MNVLYPAFFEYDRKDKRYTVSFPDLSEAITEGASLEEAFFNASEVLTLTLEGRFDEGMEIPQPSHHKNAKLIAPSARAQAALLLKWAKGEHSIAEIARALNTSWPAAARLEDPHHWPNLRQLERAAATVGHSLVISLEPIPKAHGL
jgi:antitoxin HicB